MPAGFRMSIGADLAAVAKVNAAVAGFADEHALSASVRRSLHVVLDELLANTVLYGLAGRADGTATVEMELGTNRLTVTLTDNGVAFDPLARAAPDTTLSIAEREIGGLGIHLVKQMMDEVTYHRRDDTNVVVLSKRLAAGETAGHRGGSTMEITTRTQGDITIVAIAGNLDSITSPEAQKALDAVIAGGAKKVALDFTTLDYISSAGLRVMLGAAKKLMGSGGGLRMFGLNQTVKEVFDVSGFSSILAVFPNETTACQGF